MADDQNDIRISITLDDGSVKEGFARIKRDGEDAGHGLSESFKHARNEILALIGAYVSFEAGKRLIEESISAAAHYETALNNMNKALASAGSWTKDASSGFLELAESIEKTTTVSVTQALGLEAQARNYARNNEQAKALTKAAIDLSAATGKDLNASLQQLGGTLDGTAGRLGKLAPQIRSLTEMQLRHGEAIAIVSARFKDAAAGDVNTWEGSIKRLGNAFETLYINIGKLITNSPTIRAVIKFITEEVGKFAKMLSGLNSGDNFMKNLVNDAITVGRALNDYLILPLEIFANTAKLVFNAVGTLFVAQAAAWSSVAAKVLEYFSPKSAMAQNVRAFATETTQLMDDMASNTAASFKDLGKTNWTEGIESGLNKLQTVVDNAKPLDGIKKDIKQITDDSDGLSGPIINMGHAWSLATQGMRDSLDHLAKDSVKAMQDIGAAAVKSLAGGVGNAMAQVGKTLVKGGDLFKAFAGAMMGAFGQALIQLGTGYIALGLARILGSYGSDGTGWGLVAQGSTMAVLGGAMTALGGDTGSSAAGAGSVSGGGGGGLVGSIDSVANPATAVSTKETQKVVVNIHGSVFDSKDTGLRIVDLVNEAFNTQGARVQVT